MTKPKTRFEKMKEGELPKRDGRSALDIELEEIENAAPETRKICFFSLTQAEPFYCLGEQCMAWIDEGGCTFTELPGIIAAGVVLSQKSACGHCPGDEPSVGAIRSLFRGKPMFDRQGKPRRFVWTEADDVEVEEGPIQEEMLRLMVPCNSLSRNHTHRIVVVRNDEVPRDDEKIPVSALDGPMIFYADLEDPDYYVLMEWVKVEAERRYPNGFKCRTELNTDEDNTKHDWGPDTIIYAMTPDHGEGDEALAYAYADSRYSYPSDVEGAKERLDDKLKDEGYKFVVEQNIIDCS